MVIFMGTHIRIRCKGRTRYQSILSCPSTPNHTDRYRIYSDSVFCSICGAKLEAYQETQHVAPEVVADLIGDYDGDLEVLDSIIRYDDQMLPTNMFDVIITSHIRDTYVLYGSTDNYTCDITGIDACDILKTKERFELYHASEIKTLEEMGLNPQVIAGVVMIGD